MPVSAAASVTPEMFCPRNSAGDLPARSFRDTSASNLEHLDIASPSVDLKRSLAERSAQIIRASSAARAVKGQRLNASIDT